MSRTPDARESNAGDDFHFVWAARRSLRLLDTTGNLTAVRPEGPAPDEAAEMDPDGDLLLGIDLTEYFGGNSFENSDRVVHSQLKYSTRNSGKSWTTATLCAGKKQIPHDGSVIHRLSQVFAAHINQYGSEEVLSKLSICLVSNRPCSPDLISALDAAQAALRVGTLIPSFDDFYKVIDEQHIDSLNRIRDAARNLSDDQVLDFLQVLDLSMCGHASRLDQDLALIKELGQFGFPVANDQYNSLTSLIRRRMMPENRDASVLTADDVVPALGVSSVQSLFPAEARFEPTEKIVSRACVRDIAEQVLQSDKGVICLHGGAGIGKTTLVRSMTDFYPAGSTSVLFDCYGGGTYLDPAEARHGHDRAVMQICNELARQVGTSLLLRRDASHSDLLRELLQRLRLASTLVRSESEDAVVLIVIDAADNSVVAARETGGRSFVHDLVACEIPEGVRLILTARSHRIDELKLPQLAELIPIPPFDLPESTEHLRYHIPEAEEADAKEFHELSNKTPRVQRYALANHGDDVDRVLQRLRPNIKTVESLIDDQLRAAFNSIGDSKQVQEFFEATLALPRPIHIPLLGEISGLSEEWISDICVDLSHGLVRRGQFLGFRDEDFETHLRNHYHSSDSVLKRTAQLLLSRASKDAYSAANVADALFRANMLDEVVQLVLEEREPQIVPDPIERKEVFVRRARFALRRVIERNDTPVLIKLLFVIAHAAKTDDAVKKLLLDNPDLAFRFGNPASLQRLYLDDEHERIEWYGPTHLALAAFFSRSESFHNRSRSHLRSAEAWIRWWGTLADRDRQEWDLDRADVANGAEAELRLHGMDRAIWWLHRWRPPEWVYEAVCRLAVEIIQSDGLSAFDLIDDSRKLRADVIAAIADAGIEAGVRPPKSLVERGLRVWSRARHYVSDITPSVRCNLVSLCESAVAQGVPADTVDSLLQSCAPNPPEHARSYSGPIKAEMGTFLRAATLRAAIGRQAMSSDSLDLLPLSLREDPDGKDKSEADRIKDRRREFRECYDILLPAYSFRTSRILNCAIDNVSFDNAMKATVSGEYGRDRFDQRRAKALSLEVIAEAVVINSEGCLTEFQQICEKATRKKWLDAQTRLSDIASRIDSLHEESLKLLAQVETYTKSTPLPGNEKKDLLIKCCRISSRIDSDLGEHYFTSAVEAANEIDEEAFPLLRFVTAVCMKAARDNPSVDQPQQARTFASFVEDCRLRLEGWDHFPSEECVEAITLVSPTIGCSAICRWDQMHILSFQDHILSVIRALRSRDDLDATAPLYWMYMAHQYDGTCVSPCLEALDVLRSDSSPVFVDGFGMLVDYCTRLADPQQRDWMTSKVFEWTTNHGSLAGPAYDGLMDVMAFLDSKNDQPDDEHLSQPSVDYRQAHEDEVADLIDSINWQFVEDISSLVDAEILESSIQELGSKGDDSSLPAATRELTFEFFRRVSHRVAPVDFVGHLNAIVQIKSHFVDFFVLEQVLADRLKGWSYHSNVRIWRDGIADQLVARWFEAFWFHDSFSTWTVTQLEEKTGISSEDILDAIVSHLPENIVMRNAGGLYELAQALVEKLPPGDAVNVLSFVTEDLERRLGDTPLIASSLPIDTTPSTLEMEATLLWYLFAHPDKKLRWHAIHTVRAGLQLRREDLLQSLATWLERGRQHPWSMPDRVFYWLAARQSLFLVFDKASSEYPHLLAPLCDIIRREVLSPLEAHAFIRRLAARSAHRLKEFDSSLFTTDELDEMSTLLSPRIDQRDRKRESLRTSESRTRRFNFDTMDTVPYWFGPLARMFGINTDTICEMAETWICDRWQQQGDVWSIDPVRNHDWDSRSNRHGSEPVIEDLQTYLEFHAMQCVAAELARSHSVGKSEWEWEGNQWESWLNRWDLVEQEHWLSGFRQRPPLEERFWREPDWDAWKEPPTVRDFDLAVGIDQAVFNGRIVVRGREEINSGRNSYHTASIYSALVSPMTARSLVSALQHCRGPVDYRLPWEGDDLQITHSVAGMDFELNGWIVDSDSDSTGTDKCDPFRYDFTLSLMRPGDSATKYFDLVETDSLRSWSRQSDLKNAIVIKEMWNDRVPYRRHERFATSGQRLMISFNELVSFLQAINRTLIIECQIWRSVSNRHSPDDETTHGTQAQLYLIHSDGRIESVAGSRRTREADC